MRTRWLILAAVLSSCADGRGGAEPSAGAPRVVTAAESPPDDSTPALDASVVLLPPGRDPVEVRVELARTSEERRLGLMHRQHLDADAGMLFLFEAPSQLSFWMRNTYIPLDMIFIEPSMAVLGVVENAEPRTDTSRSVPGQSQYVLEVNAGFAREHGIEAGTQVRFEGVEGL